MGKSKEEENANVGKESAWGLEEHLLVDDTNGTEISQGREAGDENFEQDYPKFPSETSSSDLTQGTPFEHGVTDDLQSQFLHSDEANSSAHLYSLNMQYCSSNLIQVQS